MFKKIINKLFCWNILYAGKPAEYPFLSAEFRGIYNELHKKENEIIEKIKKKYPKIPKENWEAHRQIQQDGFAHIKKDYKDAPACINLSNKIQENLARKDFDRLIDQYTQHTLEKNGIDPKKIDIYYDYNSLPDSFETDDDSFTNFTGFSNARQFLDYEDFFTHHTTKRPRLFVNTEEIYKHIKTINFKITVIDYSSTAIAECYVNSYITMCEFVEFYYGAGALKDPQLIQLATELDTIYMQNAFIIAAMRSEYTAFFWYEYINDFNTLPFGFEIDYSRVLQYLDRIKNIFQNLRCI